MGEAYGPLLSTAVHCYPLLTPLSRYGQLQRGCSVTLDDGTVVRAEQVMGPGQQGPGFAVVDCPSLGHLQSLEDSQAMRDLAALTSPSTIVHCGPPAVVNSEYYRSWMGTFPIATSTHIMVNEEVSQGTITFRGATEQQVPCPLPVAVTAIRRATPQRVEEGRGRRRGRMKGREEKKGEGGGRRRRGRGRGEHSTVIASAALCPLLT